MKVIYMVIGFFFVGLSILGMALPMLPTTPFLIIAGICFAKSSKKLSDWLSSTKLYKKHCADYVESGAMTRKTKIYVIFTVTLVMGFAFVFMKEVPIARIILGLVWFCHIVYFGFRVKTLENDKKIVVFRRICDQVLLFIIPNKSLSCVGFFINLFK